MQVIIEQSELDGIRVYGVTSTNESVKLEDTEALKPHIDALLAAVEALSGQALKEATDTIKTLTEQLEKFNALVPKWEDIIGSYVQLGTLVRFNGSVYEVKQAHNAQSDWAPNVALTLFTRKGATEEAATEADTIKWEPGTYSKGARVTHNGAIYVSQVDNNHWEPGAVGVNDNVWKKEA